MSKENKKETKKETTGKKPLVKKIIIVIIILIIGFIVICALPFLYLRQLQLNFDNLIIYKKRKIVFL